MCPSTDRLVGGGFAINLHCCMCPFTDRLIGGSFAISLHCCMCPSTDRLVGGSFAINVTLLQYKWYHNSTKLECFDDDSETFTKYFSASNESLAKVESPK